MSHLLSVNHQVSVANGMLPRVLTLNLAPHLFLSKQQLLDLQHQSVGGVLVQNPQNKRKGKGKSQSTPLNEDDNEENPSDKELDTSEASGAVVGPTDGDTVLPLKFLF